MRILGNYIASTYLKILSLCIGAFVSIYLVIDFLEKLRRFANSHAEIKYIGLFFLCKIPGMASQVIPLATLMATLLTLGGLSRTSEITAMRSCGISLGRITMPILLIGFATSVATLFANEVLTPASYAKMQYVQQVLIERRNPNTFFRQQNIWYRDESTILEAKLFDPESKTLRGITVWQLGQGMAPLKRIEADAGIHKGNGWIFTNCTVRDMGNGNAVSAVNINEMRIPLALKIDDLKILEKGTDNMGILALKSYCDKLRRGGYDPTRYVAQMHSRISLPFACLVMAFLGIPFALRSGRSSGIAMGTGITLGIGFSYFIINSMVLSFGQAGVLPPIVAGWAANSIFAALGLWLSMTISR